MFLLGSGLKYRNWGVLDLRSVGIVNGGSLAQTGSADGAIAQLGERVVRNDEVGGSIPPGSTKSLP